MRIKFLESCPSDSPEYPFQAGQIIDVDEPSPHVLGLVASGRAIRLDIDERAVEPDAATPEPVRVKGSNRRVLNRQ